MEDEIGTVQHWSNQKEPEQAKSKDEVIRRNLDRIHISAATPLPSNPTRHHYTILKPFSLSRGQLFAGSNHGTLSYGNVFTAGCPP